MDEVQKSRRLIVASIVTTIAIFLAFSVVACEVVQRRNTADEEARENALERELLCKAENTSRNAVRDILKLAQEVADNDTPEERAASREFYARALLLVLPVDCDLFLRKDP